jgi:ABC-type phosphate transport system substrate-binding protein
MQRRLAIRCLVLAALAWSRPAAADDRYIVIVNPNNPITSIDRDDLRDIYLKRTITWQSGGAVHPVDLPKQLPARERFTHEVLRKTKTQLRSYWSRQIFSGKAVPPAEAGSVREMIDRVLSQEGAIGYLPIDADPGKARVVKVQ